MSNPTSKPDPESEVRVQDDTGKPLGKRSSLVVCIALAMLLLGIASTLLGANVASVVGALLVLAGLVVALAKFRRDNREAIRQAKREDLLKSALRSARLTIVVFVLLLPGVAIHFLLSAVIEIGIHHINKEINGQIMKTVDVAAPNWVYHPIEWIQWAAWGQTKQEVATITKGLNDYLLQTLAEALRWLDRLFIAYLVYVAFWLWARFAARAYAGQSGNIRFTLRDQP